jgi:pSer/pThr/pTyr-binding forkhead associated (FHA) protein
VAYVFCNQCGHRNPPESSFCSSCGLALDLQGDRTITLTAVDPLLESTNSEDDIVVTIADLPLDAGVLIVRAGEQAGDRFVLRADLTRLGRHPESEIMLDDITVSRRHAQIDRTAEGYVVSDAGSLNGTYVNQERIERAVLHHGDELQVGKFRLVLFERSDA